MIYYEIHCWICGYKEEDIPETDERSNGDPCESCGEPMEMSESYTKDEEVRERGEK